MPPELEELARVVGTMPRDMAREVLNFARYLQRKQHDGGDWDEDIGSRYADPDAHDLLDRWDAVESPAGSRDLA